MSRTLRLTILAIAVLISLAIPQGCTPGNGGQSPSTPEETSQAEPPEDPTVPEDPSEPADPADELEAIPPEEDTEFLEGVLLLYGGEYDEFNDGRMRTSVLSLYYADDWQDPVELTPGAYYSWFLADLLRQDLTDEDYEQYSNPERPELGWFFPQDLYEPYVQSYFNVSTEHLRSDDVVYHAEDEAYWIGGGPGIGMRPFVELAGVEVEGDLLLLRVDLVYDEDYMEDEHKLLGIRLTGTGWNYDSYTSVE